MKVLLVAINAKYIHSNLGVYSLKAYGEKRRSKRYCSIEIGEYTINHEMDGILQDIYKRKPDVAGFSCYIWNIKYVIQIARDLKKVLPHVRIWLGGPEVSYDARERLQQIPEISGIMVGEGEETFADLVDFYERMDIRQAELERIPGIVFRARMGQIITTASRPLLSMDQIPFPYKDLAGMEHRIIYYESSRGCPFSCSYCLSSIDKSVRFRSLELVKQELAFFLEQRVPQVKFVDRTFNCKKSHCLAIWRFLLEQDNGITNFHFEISADLLDQEQLEVLKQMRPGLVQLEIGVQTTNTNVIKEIHRTTDLERLKEVVGTVKNFHNIHQHLDLIAGLPYEDFESFRKSFDEVYEMRPDQLQLGFLKVLKGSYMEKMAEKYDLLYHEEPPYEVLSNRWMSYEEILRLKTVEEMVEVYYNSGQFGYTLREMEKLWESPYDMFESIGRYYESHGLMRVNHSRLARYEILYDFLKEREGDIPEIFVDLLMYDLYLRENVKSRPKFARDQKEYRTKIRDFFIEEKKHAGSSQVSKMAHVEAMGDGSLVLFDYTDRDPLSHNARAVLIDGSFSVLCQKKTKRSLA